MIGSRQQFILISKYPPVWHTGSLTFDFSKSTYTITFFISSFLYFTLQGYPLTGTCRSLVVDLFFSINRISVHWSWNFSWDVLANCMWSVSKPDIRILFPCRFLKGYGEGSGWVLRLFSFNLLICLIQISFKLFIQAFFFNFYLYV